MDCANSKAVRWQDNDLWLSILVQPNAKKTKVIGPYQSQLKIQITAQALENQANLFLIEWLATEFKVPKTKVILEKGQHSRSKLFVIKSPRQLPDWIQDLATKDISRD